MALILVITIVAVVVVVIYVVLLYRRMREAQEIIEDALTQVEDEQQRRFDLITDLIKKVKGFAAQEKDACAAVTSACTAIKDAEHLAQLYEAEDQLEDALECLLKTAEAYPKLMANQGFIELQAELSEAQYNVVIMRKRYSEMVAKYNAAIKAYPAAPFAKYLSFHPIQGFDLAAGPAIPPVETAVPAIAPVEEADPAIAPVEEPKLLT